MPKKKSANEVPRLASIAQGLEHRRAGTNELAQDVSGSGKLVVIWVGPIHDRKVQGKCKSQGNWQAKSRFKPRHCEQPCEQSSRT